MKFSNQKNSKAKFDQPFHRIAEFALHPHEKWMRVSLLFFRTVLQNMRWPHPNHPNSRRLYFDPIKVIPPPRAPSFALFPTTQPHNLAIKCNRWGTIRQLHINFSSCGKLSTLLIFNKKVCYGTIHCTYRQRHGTRNY